jgi:transcriptional regulator with XRE-family HTH domain
MDDQTKRYPELGERLALLREARKISQREVAERAHIGHSYIAKLERGRGRPSPQILKRLADLYEAPYAPLAVLAGYQEREPTPDEDDEIARRMADRLARVQAEVSEIARDITQWNARRRRPPPQIDTPT